ncbi:MAG: hypothetical protein ABFD92_01210 [Planctomycetaceae bacterium]|nr:hypothetical protein [Planctomycetaceae bacterium]
MVVIVAVALVVLLPSLSMVRQAAVRSTCQASLHAVGTAAAAHSVSYNFSLPPYHADGAIAFDTFRMRLDSGEYVNLGALLNQVHSPQTFYCPGQDADTSASIAYDSPENRWHEGGAAGGGEKRGAGTAAASGPAPRPGLNSSYTARFVDPGEPQTPRWTVPNYMNKVIYSDFIGVDDWPARGRFQKRLCSPHQRRGYNRLFGDGSVLWTGADPVNAQRPVTGNEPTAEELSQYWLLLDVLR